MKLVASLFIVFALTGTVVACADRDSVEGELSVVTSSRGGRALECSAVAGTIAEFLAGLDEYEVAADGGNVPGTVECAWSDRGQVRRLNIGQEPRVTSVEEMGRIRAGEVYGGDDPAYRVIENDRLRAIGAVAVVRDDSDTVDEIGSFASLHLHTPQLRISVAGWTVDAVLEIATRIAEAASE